MRHGQSVGDAQAIREGYAELLSRVPWSYFVTLTVDPKGRPRRRPDGSEWMTSGRMGEESWQSAWSWFLPSWIRDSAIAVGQARRDELGRLRGPWANAWRAGRGRPQWVLALEPHRDDRLHAHGLVRLTRDVDWLDYRIGQKLWTQRGTWCRFERPRNREDVSAYVCKYVVKCGSDALTFSDNFEAPRLPAATAAAFPPAGLTPQAGGASGIGTSDTYLSPGGRA